jgi:hypothetical protein
MDVKAYPNGCTVGEINSEYVDHWRTAPSVGGSTTGRSVGVSQKFRIP